MAQYEQQHSLSSARPACLDIEPARTLDQNCIDDVVTSIVHWLGRRHELLYIRTLSFAFTSVISDRSEEIGSRLHVRAHVDAENLERFHGLRSIAYETLSSEEALALIQGELKNGTPVALSINSFWVPWDDQYQQSERIHACIVVGIDPQTQDLYCTDPFFMQKGILLPVANFHKGYLGCLVVRIVHDEVDNMEPIAQAMIDHIQRETANNRPFIQMRELADAFTTTFQGAKETERYAEFSEVPLFLRLTEVVAARIKYGQLLNYLGTKYDARFLLYEERFTKISHQWGLVRSMLLKMFLAARWPAATLQKVALRILNVSVEEQALVYELLALLRTYSLAGKANGDVGEAFELDEDWDALDDENEYVAPRTSLETQLAVCWEEVLEGKKIGIQDNFFALGGQSLKAVGLLARLEQRFHVHIPISILFQYPTIQELALWIEGEQQAPSLALDMDQSLIAEKQHALGPSLQRIPLHTRSLQEHDFPLSFAQQRLWFLDQLEHENTVYNLTEAIELSGSLNIAALSASLEEIVHRHEALRTTFLTHDGQPVQHIAADLPLPLLILDLQELSLHERDAEKQRLMNQEIGAPFDLSRGPLMRARILRVAPQRHVLLLTLHHIVTDGWSMDILTRELVILYRALCVGAPARLPALPIQYVDYAIWQRTWLQGEVLEQQLEYWKQHLSGAPTVLEFPHDYVRPPVLSYRGAAHFFRLASPITRKLKQLSRTEGVTLFMTLLGAFQMLLSCYSGQSDLVIGTPIANRPRQEIEGLIGFFVNTLALRADLAGDPSFEGILLRVKRTALASYEHQDIPFEQVVEALQPERSLHHTPIFQVMFILQNTPTTHINLEGLQLSRVQTDVTTTQFDLILTIQEKGEELLAIMEYSTDLFKEQTIQRLARNYQELLETLITYPQQPMSKLALLSKEERQQVVIEWNRTQAAYSFGGCLHEAFEQQVARTPDAIALVFEQQQQTYQDLNAQANQLAHILQMVGVGPDVLVGVFMERSLEMVVALLGILKAGGAYVPLEPTYPQERLAFMLTDASPSVILTQQRLRAQLPSFSVKVLCVDQLAAEIAQQPVTNLIATTSIQNLAYMIYTSGSTGQPKGAMNTHAGIVNRLLWMQDAYQMSATERVLQKTPFSFDVAVWEFFWPLITGACLVVAKPGGHRESAYLVEQIVQQGITTLHFVPSMLQVFLQAAGLEECRSLIRVICSGEALSWAVQERFFARLSAELHNLYGPTEAAVDVTFWACEPGGSHAMVPIGRPIANTQIYLLDPHLRPVPIGVVGELYIGGVGLARGYWQRPELTAERFIASPFGPEVGARLYQTGDRARFLEDGAIEFLGRVDYQVKLRGFRLELGEIETVLNEHPAICESVVLVREDRADDPRLVAYVVPDPAHAFPIQQALRLEKEGRLQGRSWYELPNGLPIIHQNTTETDFTYREIFEEQEYLQEGIILREGDCIFDVGANIGLFALFVRQRYRDATIYAFEPIPAIFALLQVNTELYGGKTHLMNCGLSNEEGMATFTYYPHVSILSGQFASGSQEREVLRSFVLNETELEGSESLVEELLTERLRSEEIACPLKTVSQVMREQQVQQIDLLKIDVEKSELAVLQGIEEQDWPKIRQLVIEVHDSENRVEQIVGMLKRRDYEVRMHQQGMLKETGLYLLSAVQRGGRREPDGEEKRSPDQRREATWSSQRALIDELRSVLQHRVPEYMVPSAFVALDSLPLTPNGKLDRRALPVPEQRRLENVETYVAPRTHLEEQLAEIWTQVLGVTQVSIHDTFFALGGHSLLATVFLSRVRSTFQVELSVRTFFEIPTIAEIAAFIESNSTEALQEASRWQVLAEIEELSDEEIDRLLAEEEDTDREGSQS